MNRTVIGFLISPFIGVATLMLFATIFLDQKDVVLDALAITAIFLIPTYTATFFIGIPVHYLLQDNGYTSLTAYILGGYIISAITFFLVYLILPFGTDLISSVSMLVGSFFNIFNVAGIIAGAVFWHIVVRGSRRA